MLNTVRRRTTSAWPKSSRTSAREFQFALRVIRYQFIRGTKASGCFCENLRIAGLLITLTVVVYKTQTAEVKAKFFFSGILAPSGGYFGSGIAN